jgi:putative DNA primase/helicase
VFFAYGTGANGKSVVMNTLLGMMGSYAVTSPIETFMASDSDRHPTELADLAGARLVCASETEQGRRWAESRLKQLTGGDPVKARFMRQDFFTFRPRFKLFIAGNHKPALRGVDEAIRRRLHLIPFAVTIPPHERDPTLSERLKAEWPAILRWAIDGYRLFADEGLNPPRAVTAATDQYFEGEDAIAQWIEDRCERAGEAFEASAALFSSWKSWAASSGEYVGGIKRFSQSLESHGLRPIRKPQARGFIGLRLRGSLGEEHDG